MSTQRYLGSHREVESIESSLDLLVEILPLLSHVPCGCETGQICAREMAHQKVAKHLHEHLPRDQFEHKPHAARQT